MELDEILRTFDPLTRSRFSTWLDQQGQAVRGNGEEISAALENLTPFAEETDEVLEALRHQSGDTRRLVRDTGAVFEALTERQGQLRDLIVNSNRVWDVTARRNEQLADTFRVLPTFLRESRTTTRRLTRFARDTDPLVTQLRPAARGAVADAGRARGAGSRPAWLVPRSGPARAGCPAAGFPPSSACSTTPARFWPGSTFLRQLTPIVDYLGLYRREITAFFANDAAVTQTQTGGGSATSGGRSTTCAPRTRQTRR